MKEFEVELKATTYRTFYVSAENKEEAEELAFYALDNDEEISGTWKDEACVSFIKSKDENQ